ncbi:MAG: Bug family tripartite tricarboxylate transporter substrate binding protein [Betaproteobacteria bacterium]
MRTLALALLAVLPLVATAQGFPSKPVRLIVPYAPGGTTDNLARALQEPVGQLLGQLFIVENRAGAGGAIGTREVARAAPDGHTLVFGNNGPHTILPVLQKDLGFDGVTSFEAVALVATVPLVVIVNGAVPANDLKGFLDYARRESRGVDYASAGAGGLGHMATELFARAAGVTMVHVPYSGGGPATASVLAGDTRLFLSTFTQGMKAHADAGKLKVLGVTSPGPTPLVPGVRPVAEVLPGFAVEAWFGVLAPAGTPAPVVVRLHEAITAAVAQPAMRERFRGLGAAGSTLTPQQFGQAVAAEAQRWAAVARQANLKLE